MMPSTRHKHDCAILIMQAGFDKVDAVRHILVTYRGNGLGQAEQVQAAGEAGLQAGAVLTALPRPNQAYWTLSACPMA